MSTEIKNTLFRFITMRVPETVSNENKKIGFVFHPDIIDEKIDPKSKSFFINELINPKSTTAEQFNVLLIKSNSYNAPSCLLTKIDLENLIGSDFLNFSNNLSKIKSATLSKKTAEEILDNILPKELSDECLVQLWDNVFYQIITQNNASLRDVIMNVIISNHCLVNGLTKQVGAIPKISIVIPKLFFGSENNQNAILNKNSTLIDLKQNQQSFQELERLLYIDDAKQKIELSLKTKDAIKLIEKKFLKDEAKRSATAQIEFDTAVSEAYKKATYEEIEIENKITGEITTKGRYKNLVLPQNNYEPKEFDIEMVISELKLNILEFIDEEILLGCENFQEVYDSLDLFVINTNKKINSFTTLNNKIAIVAGVPINTKESLFSRNSNIIPYSASLTYSTMRILSKLNDGNSTPELENNWINFKVAIANITQSDLQEVTTAFSITKTDGTILFDNIWLTAQESSGGAVVYNDFDNSYPLQISKSITQIIVKATIILIDASFDLEVMINIGGLPLSNNTVKMGSSYSTIVETTPDSSSGSNTNSNSSGTNGNTNNPSEGGVKDNTNPVPLTFIPSKFGIKNLGIADYRKVEQEVCCYEAGEVSHIENIMAREYKEKSTERSRTTDTTTTTSSEIETENLTDTTSTTRNEMHSEVAQVLHEDTQLGVNTSVNQSWGTGSASINGNFAHNTSQDDSTLQAITYAQDVTQRAMERIVAKIKTEKISKVIETYKENNKHGFDNTKGNEHVSGVYRWINKVYNNQIVNYGKRAMVEFMLPEPARFHILASIKNEGNNTSLITDPPIDPRSNAAGNNKIENYLDINNINNKENYLYWASIFGVEINQKPLETINLSKSFARGTVSGNGNGTETEAIKIPQGYVSTSGKIAVSRNGESAYNPDFRVIIGNKSITRTDFITPELNVQIPGFINEISVGYGERNHYTFNISFTINCALTKEAENQWKLETFNAIIAAYEEKLIAYNKAVQDAKDKAAETIGTNPLYYRQIERNALKKNIMHYLVSDIYIGQNYLTADSDLKTLRPNNDSTFDVNASVTRFMEQAFEWDIMSYAFLPFYWGSKDRWKATYNYQFDDALFTNFMQAGMARVILTVRPGFEKAVNWYMATGQVWNGGQVPTLGHELFLSIDQELKDIKPTPEGLPWKTKLPSDLTVIQSSTIGLQAEGLPCGCPDTVGGEVHLDAKIEPTKALIGGTTIVKQQPISIGE